METKKCKYCGEEKPIDMFWRNQWGSTSTCLSCYSERLKEGQNRRQQAIENGEIPQKCERKSKQMKRIAELEEQLAKANDKRLSDFTPREIFAHIKSIGYRWEKMTYTKIEEVDWNKI